MTDLNDAVAHFIAVRDERAPSDIDIEAGTNDAPWWLDLRAAFDDVHDTARAAVAAANQRAERLAQAIRDLPAEPPWRAYLRWLDCGDSGAGDEIQAWLDQWHSARALVADQPATGESDQPSPFKVERSDHTHSNEGAFFVDDGIGVEFFPTQEAADAYVARLRALVADQPIDADPGWPDETRRQPDQEHT